MTERRNAMSVGLAALNKLAGLPLLDRLGLREPMHRAVYQAAKTGFQAAGTAGRTFAQVKGGKTQRLPDAPSKGLLDLTPTDDQQMIVETVTEFAAEQLRPQAAAADTAAAPPDGLVAAAAELGLTVLGVPEESGGLATEQSTVTGVLVAEALAHGDLGLAVACLAPAAVSTALVAWGDADQQATYLPAFVDGTPPVAALAMAEPRPLFDPFDLRTKAHRTADGFVLSGTKSLVPRAGEGELFVVAADLEGRGPALFIVESGTAGVTTRTDPAMGLHSAALGRLTLDQVRVPESALLGDGSADAYKDCVRRSRLAWCALAVGTGQAVLDYVTPYVNERVAFGEPISHRQGVAFKVADIATELAGMRLVTYRAASRAEQGKSFAREVALARKLCVDKGMAIGSDGVQLLGGHGYVTDHPVERWYRDLRVIGVADGVVLV